MKTKKFAFIILAVIALSVVGTSLFHYFNEEEEEIRLIPKERIVKERGEVSGTEVGTGRSTKNNPEEAVKEAVEKALEGKKDKSPDFAIIFATSGSDLKAILTTAKKILGSETKIYGGTSDSRAVMTDKGYVKVSEKAYALMEGKRGLAVMTISSEDLVFGVGAASYSDYPSAQEASKAALLNALKNAGKSREETPKVVLITPTIGKEEETIEGIEEIISKKTILLGGTSGGPKLAVFGENEVYDAGVSLAVIYTDLPIGWTFEGGFDVTDNHTGIATKVDGQAIVAIDNRPALDVYDKWLGGRIRQLINEGQNPGAIRDLLTLHPIYRKYMSSEGQDYFLFSHPWPKDETLKEKSIMTSTKIKVGERIYLSHGTWETLVNRIGNLPKKAKIRAGIEVDKSPIFGIGYICAGVMGVIPENEREKMPLLINYSNNNAPFIAAFTWGEQGHFPGICNKHGNLLTSFLLIGGKGVR
jgi:hypothetical protein